MDNNYKNTEKFNENIFKNKSWLILIVVYLASLAVTTSMMKVPPMMNILILNLKSSLTIGGFFMSFFMIPGVVLAIPVASFINFWGLKKCGTIALGFTMIGSIIGSLAKGSVILLIGRLIEGVGFAGIMVVAPTVISLWFEPKKRGLPMGIWSTWVPVGMFIIYNLAKPLELAYNWQGVWLFTALIALIALIAYYKTVDSPFVIEEEKVNKIIRSRSTTVLKQGLENLNTLRLTFIFLVIGMAIQGFGTWLPAYLIESGLQPAKANFYCSLMSLGMIMANLIAGLLLIYIKNHKIVLSISVISSIIIFILWFAFGSVFWVIPWMLLIGVFSGLSPTCIFTMATETVAHNKFVSLALALVNMGFNFGVIIGPPIIGMVINKCGWVYVKYFVVIPLMIGLMLAFNISDLKEKY